VVSHALVSHTKKVIEGNTEGKQVSDIKVDTKHPNIFILLNSIPSEYRERGHQAIIDEIQTLVILEVVEWAPLPQGRKSIPCRMVEKVKFFPVSGHRNFVSAHFATFL
jgi:hypothetical protein